MQTNYAELLERCATAAFAASFKQDGTFIKKAVKGRRYWYFQSSTEDGRSQKYVGPETPELLAQIEHHKEAHDDERERRALAAALVRSFRLPRPKSDIGNVIDALAKAGVFRLRAVLVGTVAYQIYPAMLGTALPNPSLQTDDIDIAQFEDVSIADQTRSVIDILKEVDNTFRPVPTIHGDRITSYVAKGGLRVEFLKPNRGPETDSPRSLPALQTNAQPLRFLDFLIHEPEQAVVLHGPGILVLVPSPQRYAVHKLIISRRRRGGNIKRDKDVQQAEALLNVLNKKHRYELGEAWNEAFERGEKWAGALAEAMTQIEASTRDLTLKIANRTRSILPRGNLTFDDRPAAYDFSRDAVVFHGRAFGRSVTCRISRKALDDNFEPHHSDNAGRLNKFREKRAMIEAMARAKYLSWPIEEPEIVLIKTEDVPELLKKLKTGSP
jgi:hypothetical protein